MGLLDLQIARLQQFLNGRDFNMQQRRLSNCAPSKDTYDYVTKSELIARGGTTTFGTLNPDTRPTSPNTNDIFISTDFNHTYRWTGTAWLVIDDGPDHVVWARTAKGVGWQLCDGSANIRQSKTDGTTQLITVPNLVGQTFPRFNTTYTGNVIAAVAPTTVAHNHTNPNTNSADLTPTTRSDVPAGGANTVVTGFNNPHSHIEGNSGNTTVVVNNNGTPQYMDGIPYIRL